MYVERTDTVEMTGELKRCLEIGMDLFSSEKGFANKCARCTVRRGCVFGN